jgi:hypothetical protein
MEETTCGNTVLSIITLLQDTIVQALIFYILLYV